MPIFKLARSGRAPLKFTGTLLADATSRVSSGFRSLRWHELQLYRREDGKLLLAIGYRTQWQGEEPRDDLLIVSDAEELDRAVAEFAPEASVSVPPSDPDKARRLAADIRSGFERAVGEILSRADITVDITDPFTQQQLDQAHEEFIALALRGLNLSRDEACAVCDANNGFFVSEGGWQHMWANIADADRLNGLSEKWEIDAEALVKKIREADLGSRYALAVAVKRFWDRCQEDTDVVLRDLGLIQSD